MKRFLLHLLVALGLVVCATGPLFAQPLNRLEGAKINIDASDTIRVCSGTGSIRFSTGCTGGGTQYDMELGTDGSLTVPEFTVAGPITASGSLTLESEGGAHSMVFNTDGTLLTSVSGGQIRWASGSAAFPAYVFAADTNTGLYSVGADALGISTGGVERLRVDNNGLKLAVNSLLYVRPGAATAPSITTEANPTTGLFFASGADTLGFSTGSVSRWGIGSTGDLIGQQTTNVIRTSLDGTTTAGSLRLGAGSSVGSVAHSSLIQLYTAASGGDLDLYAGSGGDIDFYRDDGNVGMFMDGDTGDLVMDATNGGSIFLPENESVVIGVSSASAAGTGVIGDATQLATGVYVVTNATASNAVKLPAYNASTSPVGSVVEIHNQNDTESLTVFPGSGSEDLGRGLGSAGGISANSTLIARRVSTTRWAAFEAPRV